MDITFYKKYPQTTKELLRFYSATEKEIEELLNRDNLYDFFDAQGIIIITNYIPLSSIVYDEYVDEYIDFDLDKKGFFETSIYSKYDIEESLFTSSPHQTRYNSELEAFEAAFKIREKALTLTNGVIKK